MLSKLRRQHRIFFSLTDGCKRLLKRLTLAQRGTLCQAVGDQQSVMTGVLMVGFGTQDKINWCAFAILM